MRTQLLCCFLAAALVFTGGAKAQDFDSDNLVAMNDDNFADYYGDAQFVSIATGSRKPIYKAPAVATVITADEIKAMGATTLDQALEKVPGLHVGLSTQGRLDPVYSIRGIHTKFNPQVLVLMNGISFPHYGGGRPFHFRLPISAISRIEVIRGPGSAVYGADAYAGVINIITKDAADIGGTEVGGRVGSFDTHDLWLQHGGEFAGWEVGFSLEWQRTDGDDDRRVSSDLQTTLDEIFGTDASLAPGSLSTRYDILNTHLNLQRGNWRLRHWYWGQNDAGMGAGAALALDPQGGEDFDQHLVDVTWRTTEMRSDWDLNANLHYLNRQSENRFVLLPPGTRLPIGTDGNLNFASPAGVVDFPDGFLGNPNASHEAFGIDLTFSYAGFSAHRLRLGAGGKNFRSRVLQEEKNFGPGVINGTTSPIDGTLTDVADTPNVFMPDKSRTSWYFSLQDEWQFARDWELTAGLRYDHYSDFGATVNPRLALVWSTFYNLTTKLLYGRAFRAPSFVELYSINNPVALGNPNLDPETIDTLEVSFDYRPTFNLQANLSVFAYRAEDLIEFVPDAGGGTISAQNARDQEGYGFEIEIGWDVTEKFRLNGNYGWQHSEDRETGSRIADAPGQQLYGRADWEFLPNWSLHPQVKWVASRKRAANDARPEIGDYTLVDLTLRRKQILRNWEIALALRNLFDEDAKEPSRSTIPDDYPLEGRSLWAEVRYRFGS